MDFNNQLIFFFSALGAFNGFIITIYFAYVSNKKKFSNPFLVFLMLVLSIRITKSVFFYFNPHLSSTFIQVGLSACVLIGPFSYLYLKSQIKEEKRNWSFHIFPVLILISILGVIFSFKEYKNLWVNYINRGIYLQWLIYIVLSFKLVQPVINRVIARKDKIQDKDIWLLSIFAGISFIWLSYTLGSYTSYIVGALSFSFVLYLILLLFVFRNSKNTTFFENKEKYKNKEIAQETIDSISEKLGVIKSKELYKNPNIKLSDLAKELEVSTHTLSQFLNNNLGKSFSLFINEYRIENAKELLVKNKNYTIETIGYESGFNSKSAFFTAFKKITGNTPSNYKTQALF